MKEIRLSVSDMKETLLNATNDVKVVLLIRDPRASLTSIWASPQRWERQFSTASITCFKLLDNFRDYEYIVNKFNQESPHQKPPIKLIRYEELVDNRAKIVEDLFQYLNLSTFSNYVLQRIKASHVIKDIPKTIKPNKRMGQIGKTGNEIQSDTGTSKEKIQTVSKDRKQGKNIDKL